MTNESNLENKTFSSIKNWAEEDRPREKFLQKGRSALTDAELLAILLGSGSTSMSAVELAQHILKTADNEIHILARFSLDELMKFKGIGEAKALTIAAALELGRRRKENEASKRDKILSAPDVYQTMQTHLADLPHEEFWVIYLDRASQIIRKVQISKGGIAGTVVDVKIIFQKALELLASKLILVHNHPSGNLKPSKEDLYITQQIKAACKLLSMELIEHLIFTDAGYYSFADNDVL
jgi:DNA repair protein RadC